MILALGAAASLASFGFSAAHATPFELTLELVGPPQHSLRSFSFGVVVEDSWTVEDLPGPPLGTSSFDVRFELPGVYEVQTPSGSFEFYEYRVACEWGSSLSNTGRQDVDISAFTFFSPQPRPPEERLLIITGPETGSNPDLVTMESNGAVLGGDRFQTIHFDIPSTAFTPTPVAAGSGDCTVVVSLNGPADLPDQTLLALVPEAPPIPVLGGWGMLAFAGLLGVLGLWITRRV